MVLAALYDRAEATRARIASLTEPVLDKLAPAFIFVHGVYSVALPYAIKAFHYGFIPLVLVLGMQSQPKPKLIDLIMPM